MKKDHPGNDVYQKVKSVLGSVFKEHPPQQSFFPNVLHLRLQTLSVVYCYRIQICIYNICEEQVRAGLCFFSAYLMTLCYGRLQQANFALLCHWQVRSQDSSCTICTSKPTKHLCISLSSVLHDLCRDCTTETQSSTNIYCL